MGGRRGVEGETWAWRDGKGVRWRGAGALGMGANAVRRKTKQGHTLSYALVYALALVATKA